MLLHSFPLRQLLLHPLSNRLNFRKTAHDCTVAATTRGHHHHHHRHPHRIGRSQRKRTAPRTKVFECPIAGHRRRRRGYQKIYKNAEKKRIPHGLQISQLACYAHTRRGFPTLVRDPTTPQRSVVDQSPTRRDGFARSARNET